MRSATSIATARSTILQTITVTIVWQTIFEVKVMLFCYEACAMAICLSIHHFLIPQNTNILPELQLQKPELCTVA